MATYHETRCATKDGWHASKRAFLMKVRKLLGLTPKTATQKGPCGPHEARVYSMKGGPAVAGETVLRTGNWFVQLCARGDGFNYGRTEPDRKGGCSYSEMGRNCPIPASCLARPEDLADWIRRQNWPLPCQHLVTDVDDLEGDIVCLSCGMVRG